MEGNSFTPSPEQLHASPVADSFIYTMQQAGFSQEDLDLFTSLFSHHVEGTVWFEVEGHIPQMVDTTLMEDEAELAKALSDAFRIASNTMMFEENEANILPTVSFSPKVLH